MQSVEPPAWGHTPAWARAADNRVGGPGTLCHQAIEVHGTHSREGLAAPPRVFAWTLTGRVGQVWLNPRASSAPVWCCLQAAAPPAGSVGSFPSSEGLSTQLLSTLVLWRRHSPSSYSCLPGCLWPFSSQPAWESGTAPREGGRWPGRAPPGLRCPLHRLSCEGQLLRGGDSCGWQAACPRTGAAGCRGQTSVGFVSTLPTVCRVTDSKPPMVFTSACWAFCLWCSWKVGDFSFLKPACIRTRLCLKGMRCPLLGETRL